MKKILVIIIFIIRYQAVSVIFLVLNYFNMLI
jgi:hypothetical protein